MNIKHIFFDLDHTLWDFNKNSKETLAELYTELNLSNYLPSFIEFYSKYLEVNDALWDLYRKNKISKDALRTVRFLNTFKYFNFFNSDLAETLGDEYVARSPYKSNLFEGCHEVLIQLKLKYKLYIITNGFEEVQLIKLRSSNLTQYFSHIITSEMAGVTKPHPQIFDYALNAAKAKPEESIMIGDNFDVDCIGAESRGIKAVFFNPHSEKQSQSVSFEIRHLKELLTFL